MEEVQFPRGGDGDSALEVAALTALATTCCCHLLFLLHSTEAAPRSKLYVSLGLPPLSGRPCRSRRRPTVPEWATAACLTREPDLGLVLPLAPFPCRLHSPRLARCKHTREALRRVLPLLAVKIPRGASAGPRICVEAVSGRACRGCPVRGSTRRTDGGRVSTCQSSHCFWVGVYCWVWSDC